MIDLGQIRALAQPANARFFIPFGYRCVQLLRGGAVGISVCRRVPNALNI